MGAIGCFTAVQFSNRGEERLWDLKFSYLKRIRILAMRHYDHNMVSVICWEPDGFYEVCTLTSDVFHWTNDEKSIVSFSELQTSVDPPKKLAPVAFAPPHFGEHFTARPPFHQWIVNKKALNDTGTSDFLHAIKMAFLSAALMICTNSQYY